MASPKTRLDDYLVQAGFALDKKEAQAMIMAGEVRLKGHPVQASAIVSDPADVECLPRRAFVSRGGDKLRGAMETFQPQIKDLICIDVGSSTGGFTDYLLKAGAKAVYAVDVGKGLLDISLREDPRVHVLEGVNIRHLDSELLDETTPSFATVDVSFISLEHVLPRLYAVLALKAEAVILVKPQFEGTPKEVPGGFVKDEDTRQAIIARVLDMIQGTGFTLQGMIDSEVKGRKGNQETFFYLLKLPA
jgi:23S rRNA (cytidine1920-2'-O)/16S rRNA (cytidine1409-2'-O)-methyltransferase